MSEKIVQLNEEVIKGQLKELVRGSVEETLNGLLEAEAEKLTQAGRYERSEQRQGYRSGHYNRNLMQPPERLSSMCRGSKELPLKQRLLSVIVGGNPAWKKHSWRCIWQVCRCAA